MAVGDDGPHSSGKLRRLASLTMWSRFPNRCRWVTWLKSKFQSSSEMRFRGGSRRENGARSSAFLIMKAVDAAWFQALHVRRAEQNVSGEVKRKIDWIISVGRLAAVACVIFFFFFKGQRNAMDEIGRPFSPSIHLSIHDLFISRRPPSVMLYGACQHVQYEQRHWPIRVLARRKPGSTQPHDNPGAIFGSR